MSSADHRPVQVIEPRPSGRVLLHDLWAYRSVLRALARRDLKGKYKQSVLGLAWAVAQPALQVVVFTLVFDRLAGVSTGDLDYPVYALAGLVPYNLFQQAVSTGTPAFVAAQGIVTKVYFPRLYTVLAGCTTAVVNAGVSLILLGVVMAVTRTAPEATSVLAVVPLALTGALAVGVAAALGIVNARFRDIQHALPLALSLAVYLSPALFPLDGASSALRAAAWFNPSAGLLDWFRTALVGGELYSPAMTGLHAGLAVVIALAGTFVFERGQARLVDVL